MFSWDDPADAESCDFFVGTGTDTRWLGSAVLRNPAATLTAGVIEDEARWDARVGMLLHGHRGTGPLTQRSLGWPWPWASPSETDNMFTFAQGRPWIARRGGPWEPLGGSIGASLDPSPIFEAAGIEPRRWNERGLDAMERLLFDTPMEEVPVQVSEEQAVTGVAFGPEWLATRGALFARRRRSGLHTRLVCHHVGAVLCMADDLCYLWLCDGADGHWTRVPEGLPAELRYEGATFDAVYRAGEVEHGIFRRQWADDGSDDPAHVDEDWSWFDPAGVDLAALRSDLLAAGYTELPALSAHSAIMWRADPPERCCGPNRVSTEALPLDWELPGAPRRAVRCIRLLEEATGQPWPAYGPLTAREAAPLAAPGH